MILTWSAEEWQTMYYSLEVAEWSEPIRKMLLQNSIAIEILQIAGEALRIGIKSNGIHRGQEKECLERNFF